MSLFIHQVDAFTQTLRDFERALAESIRLGPVTTRQAQRTPEDAQQRAKSLLLRHLNTEQQESYIRNRRFTVHSKSGNQYDIYYGRIGNIIMYRHGVPVNVLCIHTLESIPYEDLMLAQKLMLETQENRLLEVAGKFPVTDMHLLLRRS